MARPKSAKVYVRVGDRLFDFMWANVGPDDTVMMGLRFQGDGQIELVIDPALGELRPPNIEAPHVVSRPKISFHRSGQYKLDVQMGLNSCAIDRSTVIGPRFEDIVAPRRMAELLFPETLPVAETAPTNRDIILDATAAPRRPLICTISCMADAKFPGFVAPGVRAVDTSDWEVSQALTSGTHAWAWTLRTSARHTVYPNRFIVGLLGEVKWGQPTK
ncbi:MAG: hypothetical protein WEB85_00050 [Dongiaceae bacterium]